MLEAHDRSRNRWAWHVTTRWLHRSMKAAPLSFLFLSTQGLGLRAMTENERERERGSEREREREEEEEREVRRR